MKSDFNKLLILTPTVSRIGAGLFNAVRCLAMAQNQQISSAKLLVFSFTDSFTHLDIRSWSPLNPKHFKRRLMPGLGFSRELVVQARSFLDSGSVLHVHGIWEAAGAMIASKAKSLRRPYLISPHGMLDSWALNQSRLKKSIANAIYVKRYIEGASCIHALCESEYDSIRSYGFKGPISIIENGVDIPKLIEGNICHPAPWKTKEYPKLSGRKILLFLGRVAEKKGLFQLINAWNDCKQNLNDWALVIAGPSDPEAHLEQLRNRVDELELNETVAFIGPQFGDDKIACYQQSAGFVLTSFSEGVPLAVLEAASYRLPLLISSQCNIPKLESLDAAITIDARNQASLLAGLRRFLGENHESHTARSLRAYEYVKDECTWDRIATQHLEVYRWLTGQRSKPDYVRLD
ncbi:MAG: glycosyltransferase [Flavobacterium sp.]|nr:MAG: glycosyltransferase [Flavobacterium sp.]